jgi:hypothetical protein
MRHLGPLCAWVIPEFLEAVGRRIVKLFGKVPVEVHTVSIMPTIPVHKHTTNKALVFLTKLIFERTKKISTAGGAWVIIGDLPIKNAI